MILLQVTGQNPPTFIFFLLLFIIFYFFMIRPQVKKQKNENTYRDSLKKGDKIITSGGIYGKIQEIKKDSFIVSIDNNVKIQIKKSSVSMEMSKSINKSWLKQVGLTGGIGSGKTYVSRVFAKLGIPVFNSDIQAKKLMSSNSILINSLKQKFGDDIYNKNKINRERIRNIIFKDQNSLKLINDIVHPFVNQDFNDWTNNQDADYVVKEAAILFETGGYKLLDCNILVYSPINLNIERVMLRDKLDKDKVIEIINSQASFYEVKKKADYIIYNDQEDFILPQIIKIHNQILNK